MKRQLKLIIIFVIHCNLQSGIYCNKLDYKFVADSIFYAGDYAKASLFYEMALYYNNDYDINEIYFKKAKSQQLGNNFLGALTTLEKIDEKNIPDSIVALLCIEKSLCSYLLGNFQKSLAHIKEAEKYCKDKLNEKFVLLTYLNLNKLPDPDVLFEKEFREDYNFVLGKLQEEIMRLNLKSIKKAKLFSILLPGGGQFYTKNFLTGLANMSTIGGGGFLTYVSLQNGMYFTGVFCISLVIKYYIGDILQAEKMAHEYNNRQFRKYYTDLSFKLINDIY